MERSLNVKWLIGCLLILLLLPSGGLTQKYTQDLNPYEVGIWKKIEHDKGITIDYITKPTIKKGVILEGSLKIDQSYKVERVSLIYVICNSKNTFTRHTTIRLKKVAEPNTWEFIDEYKLDLINYEYELFVVNVIAEKPTI